MLLPKCRTGHFLTPENILKPKGRHKRICKTCANLRSQAWRDRNKERIKTINSLAKTKLAASRFGISVEEMQEIRQRSCAICGCLGELRHGKHQCHADHDHKTGQLRGALCASCNLGLGKFKDSEALLQRAIEYLRGYKSAAA